MRTRDHTPPRLQRGFWTWEYQSPHCRVLFLGKGPQLDRQQAFAQVAQRPDLILSWPRQVHSARVLRVSQPGSCGEGDALISAERSIALSIATADCVPVVLAGGKNLATVHAGWRGLASGILRRTLDGFEEERGAVEAWIGPAIGVCCYEVASDVAEQVVAASDPSIVQEHAPRPHLDLIGAASWQLTQGGVQKVHALSVCTRCSPDWLWSYRREGAQAKRNWTLAWRQAD